MWYYFLHIVVVTALGTMLLLISITVGARVFFSRGKNTPFESGFDPNDSARLPFSMRFFLLAVVFLIFDIEVALLIPLVVGLNSGALISTLVAGLGFLTILIVGLFHEWNQGSLSWVL